VASATGYGNLVRGPLSAVLTALAVVGCGDVAAVPCSKTRLDRAEWDQARSSRGGRHEPTAAELLANGYVRCELLLGEPAPRLARLLGDSDATDRAVDQRGYDIEYRLGSPELLGRRKHSSLYIDLGPNSRVVRAAVLPEE
jgi:hypothetical protein